MRITCLTENTSCDPRVKAEHGLCLYVETDANVFLFDTGQSALLCENAKALGVDLTKVDFAVISHGHYDHGGGIRAFLEANGHAPVYLHQNAFLPHYNGTEKYIGLDTSLIGHPRLISVGDEYAITSEITLFSGNGVAHPFPAFASGLNVKTSTGFVPDDFSHEIYLLLRAKEQSVLFSGCSHRGILNLLSRFEPNVLIGGFHSSKITSRDELNETAEELKRHKAELYTCHCTGQEQYEFFKQSVPNVHYLSAGQTIELSPTNKEEL